MSRPLLILRAGGRLCALAVEDVEETMRPLPCEPLPEVPAFVTGASIVRGRPIPIVDLGSLLGEGAAVSPSRLVIIKTDAARRVGLLVDEVLGVRAEQSLPAGDLPPLLGGAAAEIVEALTSLDNRLLTVLQAGRLVPATVWAQLSEQSS